MSFPLIVKQAARPVCVHCGAKCGYKMRGDSKITFPDGGLKVERGAWDGVTWFHKYNPFCTLRCALGFARKAYLHGGVRTAA